VLSLSVVRVARHLELLPPPGAQSGSHAHSAYNGAMAVEPQETPSFEKSIQELEALVKELERGDLPLEKSLELFERGMKLSDQCRKQLTAAETKVEMLIRRGGEMIAAPFDDDKN